MHKKQTIIVDKYSINFKTLSQKTGSCVVEYKLYSTAVSGFFKAMHLMGTKGTPKLLCPYLNNLDFLFSKKYLEYYCVGTKLLEMS